MRLFISILTIVLFIVPSVPAFSTSFHPTISPVSLSSPIAPQLMSSAIVVNYSEGSMCGGTFIRPDTVLSSAHCVLHGQDIGDIRVYDSAGLGYRIQGDRINIPSDLVVLILDQASAAARPAVLADAFIGEEIWVIGAPDGDPFLVIHGYVAGIRKDQIFDGKPHKDPCTGQTSQSLVGTAYQQYLVLDARIYFGDSGGGVFDSSGNLVGVMESLRSVGTCDARYILWGFAVGPDAIREFLGP